MKPSLLLLLLLFAAGGVGTLARYAIYLFVQAWAGSEAYPFGTSAVNALGCFGIGLLYGGILARGGEVSDWNIVAMVGFLGAFTTFSTYALDARHLLVEERWIALAAYVLVQNLVGILCVFGGIRLAR